MALLTGRISLRDVAGGLRKKYADNLWDNASDVKPALRAVLLRMAPGVLGCCMYCGGYTATDIEHFEPREHDALKTFVWPNHLLVCGPCNSTYKRDWWQCDEESGEPLLIDPTRDNPFTHLWLDFRDYEYRGLTRKGRSTIEVLGLNLPERRLAAGRELARRNIRTVLRDWDRGRQQADETSMRHALAVLEGQPFADVWQAMLRQAVLPGAPVVMSDEPPEILTLLRDEELRAATLIEFPLELAPSEEN
ncbi:MULTISPECIES: hypothetical protein [unclassified Streptomyces]|uniref:hypothetical protein n=1 Tax=unclassified Streptomyces TaxID=2593676 RepID=UPI0003AA7649|nr:MULTISPECIES: hypothetical protein [unclassified Streptomyces]